MSNTPNNNVANAQNSRIVRVRDLPIYYDVKEDDIYRYVPRTSDNEQEKSVNNNNNWLHSYISQTRQTVQQAWQDNKDLRLRIARAIETGGAHAKTTVDYIRDDHTFFPKVGVITLAGLGGLLLSHKGGVARKTFYSSVAVAVALSACYPKQSANLLDQTYGRVKQETKNLYDKTTANQSSMPTKIETKLAQSKDRILHTVKTNDPPAVIVKGDFGQGTPADQHLYTTRGVPQPNVLNAEKKV